MKPGSVLYPGYPFSGFPVFVYHGERTTFAFLFLACFALFLLYRQRLFSNKRHLFISILLLFLSFDIRYHFLDIASADYTIFLHRWVEHYQNTGGFRGLGVLYENCNYNLPYLYFMALFSYIPQNDLHLIKLLSIFFDLLLAWASMRIVGIFRDGVRVRLSAFFAVFLLPTVMINSAYWGQCDSIYVSLAFLGLYHTLRNHPSRAVIFMALSFSFKLQAVFLLPVLAVAWMADRLKFRHLLLFPLTYLAAIFPGVLMGRPFGEAVFFYLTMQDTSGSSLSRNATNLASFFRIPQDRLSIAVFIFIVLAAVFMLILLAVCLAKRHRITDRTILLVSFLFILGIPFFLPRMNDRYFYGAEILSIIIAFVFASYTISFPFVLELSALNVYAHFLWQAYLFPLLYGTAAMIPVLASAAVLFFRSFEEAPSVRSA